MLCQSLASKGARVVHGERPHRVDITIQVNPVLSRSAESRAESEEMLVCSVQGLGPAVGANPVLHAGPSVRRCQPPWEQQQLSQGYPKPQLNMVKPWALQNPPKIAMVICEAEWAEVAKLPGSLQSRAGSGLFPPCPRSSVLLPPSSPPWFPLPTLLGARGGWAMRPAWVQIKDDRVPPWARLTSDECSVFHNMCS